MNPFTSLRRTVAFAGLVLGYLMALSPAYAVPMCVDGVVMLKSAMLVAQFQSVPVEILLVQGTYVMDESIDMTFRPHTALKGGYLPGCASRQVDPANTVIDIGLGHTWLLKQPDGSPEARLEIDGITFTNTDSGVSFEAGNYVFSWPNDEGSLIVTRSRFTRISDDHGAGVGVTLEAHENRLQIENVLFDRINAADSGERCAVFLLSPEDGDVIINHVTANLENGGNFCLGDHQEDEPSNWNIFNSIFWTSDGSNARVRSLLSAESAGGYVNNVMLPDPNPLPLTVTNAIAADPRWLDPGAGNYRLKTNPLSPAINSGTYNSPGGEPGTDIEGRQRILGSFPDRGAYESDYSDQSELIVSNTHDSGGGSLRQAILSANTSPTVAKRIRFDIRGAQQVPVCPAVIALSTSLPAIAAPTFIDGYTQPISAVNTHPDAFNATLCVIVKPAVGTLQIGLRVAQSAAPTVALGVRGVAFGGFAQPVQLLGGSNHVVAGNQFGGNVLGVHLAGATINAISMGFNAGGSLIVGGPDVADRNVIIDADFSGINIQSEVQSTIDHCQVVNNLIGLRPDGHTVLANNVGINVSGAGCGIVHNRIAGNSLANVWLNGGSQRNVVQRNWIGVTADGQGVANSAVGILVNGSNNLIGAGGSGGTFTANTIRFNQHGGVVVQGDNARGNSINANFIYDNGAAGDGLDIDLQPGDIGDGPTRNDAGDLDAGANDLQNFPMAASLVYTGPGTIDRPALLGGVLDMKPGTYRIDAYFSRSGNPIGHRGSAQIHLNRTSVVVTGGRRAFSLQVQVPDQLDGGVLSLTATDSSGNTSEVGTALPIDSVFVDGMD